MKERLGNGRIFLKGVDAQFWQNERKEQCLLGIVLVDLQLK